MSVTSADPAVNGWSFTEDENAKEFVCKYVVQTDNAADDSVVVLASSALPRYGQQLSAYPKARVVNRQAQQREGSLTVWDVTITWSTETDEVNPDPNAPEVDQDDPLSFPPRITGSGRLYKVACTKWYEGRASGTSSWLYSPRLVPVLNRAGDDFDPPLEMDDDTQTVTITRNYWPLPDWVWNYTNKRNLSAFTIYGHTIAAGQAKISGIDWGSQQKHVNKDDLEIFFFEVSTTIEIDTRDRGVKTVVGAKIGQNIYPDYWDLFTPNIGYHALNDDGEQIVIRDAEGDPVSAPVLLDEDGAQITNPTADSAMYVFGRVYMHSPEPGTVVPGVDYSVIGFPP